MRANLSWNVDPPWCHWPSIICFSKLEAPKWVAISKAASPIHSSGTGLPSLNWRGISTSKRRHFLLLGSPAEHREAETLVRQYRERVCRYDHLPRAQDPSRESADQKAKSSMRCFPVRKLDCYHANTPS